MKLSGEATLNASVDEVYAALNDPAVLVRTIPGCQRLEQVGADTYRATIVAGVAAIKGAFDGEVRLTDQQAPHSFTLHASGVGAPGTVTATARVTLTPADATRTRLTYDADATVGGVIGGVGQRMISGVARKTASEFFAAVDRALAPSVAAGAPAPEVQPRPALAPVAGVAAAGMAPAGAGAGTAMAGEPPTAAVAAAAAVPATAAGPAMASGPAMAAVPAAAGPAMAAVPAAAGPALAGVWTAPVPVLDPGRQRMRDLLVGAAFGAIVALLGVLVGAIVVGW